jgi:arylsulfatase A-like enzyme
MGTPVIQTPNLDRLAREGVLFENNFCTTSICMSSRASIFTGLYTRCHGINDFRTPLSEGRFAHSYPVLIRQAGYRTAFIGKWGLGGPLPEDQFDYFRGFSGQGRYFEQEEESAGHLTRRMGQDAIEFLRTCPRTQPFCLSVSFKAPHVQDSDPRQYLYDPAFQQMYRGASIPVPKTAEPRFFDGLPDFIQQSEGRRRWEMRFPTPDRYQQSVKGYYRLINGVDTLLGRVLATLEELGLADNTVVLFTSDNGIFLGERGLAGKWLMHEESIRVPLVIRDPHIPPRRVGTRRRQMTLNIDLMPTLLEYAGLPAPANVQGRSICPLLRSSRAQWRTEWYYEHRFQHERIPQSEGVRTQRWKYIRYVEREPLCEELYDLASDPREERNLAASQEHARNLDHLRERWQVWRASLNHWNASPAAPWSEPV